jgi:hypothetical protein
MVMNEGYYLSESGNFQVWYPANFFEKGKQRAEMIDSNGIERRIDYNLHTALLVSAIFDFEFIGEL